MAKKNSYNQGFNEDWSDGPRERKDKPGKKHNNEKHRDTFEGNAPKKPAYKPPQVHRRHDENYDED